MNKTIVWLLAVWFLGGLLPAQTLDEILAMNYKAHGGLDKLKAITAKKMSGKIIVPEQGIEMPVVLWQKAPDKLRMETNFRERMIIQAFDGQKAWWITPFLSGKALEMPPEQGQFIRNQAVFENPLVVFKEKGYKLELLGKENMGGIPVFKLKLTQGEGGEIVYYLDALSGFELKSTTSLKTGETETLAEIIYGDFRDVGGNWFPFSVENKLNGKTGIRMILYAIEVNPAMEDSMFAMPDMMPAPVVEGVAPQNVMPKKEKKKSKKK